MCFIITGKLLIWFFKSLKARLLSNHPLYFLPSLRVGWQADSQVPWVSSGEDEKGMEKDLAKHVAGAAAYRDLERNSYKQAWWWWMTLNPSPFTNEGRGA